MRNHKLGTLVNHLKIRKTGQFHRALKEAKGIGTPATRVEIIGGLKKRSFLVSQGKNIVPTETGLTLFGVLEQADPALVERHRRSRRGQGQFGGYVQMD